jgi:hypothetical protein
MARWVMKPSAKDRTRLLRELAGGVIRGRALHEQSAPDLKALVGGPWCQTVR